MNVMLDVKMYRHCIASFSHVYSISIDVFIMLSCCVVWKEMWNVASSIVIPLAHFALKVVAMHFYENCQDTELVNSGQHEIMIFICQS